MPSTDIDGTPLFIMGTAEALRLLQILRGELGEEIDRDQAYFQEKLTNFCNHPAVINWTNREA